MVKVQKKRTLIVILLVPLFIIILLGWLIPRQRKEFFIVRGECTEMWGGGCSIYSIAKVSQEGTVHEWRETIVPTVNSAILDECLSSKYEETNRYGYRGYILSEEEIEILKNCIHSLEKRRYCEVIEDCCIGYFSREECPFVCIENTCSPM